MKINKEIEEQIINFGVFGYSPQKMSNILEIEIDIIQTQIKDSNSEFNKLYQKGTDTADYVIDLKLFEMSRQGDLKALEEFERRKRKRKI